MGATVSGCFQVSPREWSVKSRQDRCWLGTGIAGPMRVHGTLPNLL